MGSKDAATLSGGEFGVIGTHRTPKLLEGRSTLAALFVPGLTASTQPNLVGGMLAASHQIGHREKHHESPQLRRIETRNDEKPLGGDQGISGLIRCPVLVR